MNCTSSTNDSFNGSSNAPELQTQKPLDLTFYVGTTTSNAQILDVFVGVVGSTDNLLALIVFFSHKPLLKRPANYFLASQCALNLLGSISLILTTVVDGNHWPPSVAVAMCYLWNSRSYMSGLFQAAVNNIVLLTVERYIEIVHPIKHRLKISKSKVILSIIVGTLSGIITKGCISYSSMKFVNGVCRVGNYPSIQASRVAIVANFIIEYFIPISVFIFCYAGMARALRRSFKVTQPANHSVQPVDQKIERARRNIIKTLFIVVLGFVICSSFKHFMVLSNTLLNLSLDLSGVVFSVAQFLLYLNCCSDPIIYIINYEEFRVSLRQLFCRNRATPSESRTTHAETITK